MLQQLRVQEEALLQQLRVKEEFVNERIRILQADNATQSKQDMERKEELVVALRKEREALRIERQGRESDQSQNSESLNVVQQAHAAALRKQKEAHSRDVCAHDLLLQVHTRQHEKWQAHVNKQILHCWLREVVLSRQRKTTFKNMLIRRKKSIITVVIAELEQNTRSRLSQRHLLNASTNLHKSLTRC